MPADPYISEIMMFAGNFAPRQWSFCNGALMAIAQNTALFSLLGTTYGGDGRTTFALPDLRSRIPVGQSSSPPPGLSASPIGSKVGVETVTLTTNQIPAHTHTVMGSTDAATSTSPTGTIWAESQSAFPFYVNTPIVDEFVPMSSQIVGNSGGSQAHSNLSPFQAINFCIALIGVFPSRN